MDGAEGTEGRALLTLSALYGCHQKLLGAQIRFVDVSTAAVSAAIEVLRWDTGLDVAVASGADVSDNQSIFFGAKLYAAIRFRSLSGLHVAEARFFNVPCLFALQFPQPITGLDGLSLIQAAHDPAVFAKRVAEAIQ